MRASVRDVTDTEEARAESQRVEARYRLLACTLPDTIVSMVDADRRFVIGAPRARPRAAPRTYLATAGMDPIRDQGERPESA